MPNPKLETYKNKATDMVYDFTDADAQSKITATVDLLKDTTGWTGKNKADVKTINIDSWNGMSIHTDANKRYTINGTNTYDGTAGREIIGAFNDYSTAVFKAGDKLVFTGINNANISVGSISTSGTYKTLQKDTPITLTEDIGCIYLGFAKSATFTDEVVEFMVCDEITYKLSPAFEPYHESVEDWYWSENAKTGVHNFVLGGFSGYSIGAQGNIYADATYDLHFGIVTQGESYTVTTDDSAGFVGGYFTSMPTTSSVTYNSSRVVSANKTFTAPIDGYVVFRTTHNYATPMFCLADDSYDGYTKGAMTNRQLTDAVNQSAYNSTGLQYTRCSYVAGGYVKIGNICVVNIRVLTDDSTGNIQIDGFPSYNGKTLNSKNIIAANAFNMTDDSNVNYYSSIGTTGRLLVYGPVVAQKEYAISATYLCD